MYEPINEAFHSEKYILLMSSAWYPISFELSPNYEIIMLIQLLEIFIAVVTLASINMCSGLLILHCCQQIEILCDDIKNFRDKFLHQKNLINKNTNEIILFNCSCLKCIVNRLDNLIKCVYIFIFNNNVLIMSSKLFIYLLIPFSFVYVIILIFF